MRVSQQRVLSKKGHSLRVCPGPKNNAVNCKATKLRGLRRIGASQENA